MFPVDDETLRYLRLTGRPDAPVDLVERYAKEQGLFRTDETPEPEFDETARARPGHGRAEPGRPAAAAGPGGRCGARGRTSFRERVHGRHCVGRTAPAPHYAPGRRRRARASASRCRHGAVAIAAITSCTNTSNPSVMLGAGLLAKKAVERGLTSPPWVKTSLAPGCRVVTEYLDAPG